MTDLTGKFFWYELMTSDPDGAIRFYGDVLGWTTKPFGDDLQGDAYHVISASAGQMGGIMAIPAELKDHGMRPWWGGYIGSADVDADAKRLTDAGGSVKRAPEDIPGVGRFAVMSDPGGAIFMLLKGFSPEGMEAAPPMANGHVGWHELYSGDFDKDLAFYTSQFGWGKGQAMDMREMGSYQLFSMSGATEFNEMSGGMMARPKEVPVPLWLFYFVVPDIDEAVERVKAGGGAVLNGPEEVPGGAWIIQGSDPQGAMFALVGMRNG